jgi:hypothetical protein
MEFSPKAIRAIALGLLLTSGACTQAPETPFNIMIHETGFDTKSKPTSFKDGFVNTQCATPVYIGNETPPDVMDELRSSYKKTGHYTDKILKSIFRSVQINEYGNATLSDVSVIDAAKSISDKVGLPRYAYSGSPASCNSSLVMIYGLKSIPYPKEFDISSGYVRAENCRNQFFSFSIYKNNGETKINTSQYTRDCK